MVPSSTRAVSAGRAAIAWADAQMPVLASIRSRFAREQPLRGLRVAACLHVTAETAGVVRALAQGGAQVALCAANPLATRDEVAAALRRDHAVAVRGARGDDAGAYGDHIDAVAASRPHLVLDDGAELIGALHLARETGGVLGATEETTTGLVRLRALEAQGGLACPVVAVNEARAERSFNDRYGTGQSTVDGILRATNLLLAGQTVVVLGYGWTGRGIAQRARGLGASVVVCEVDPVPALEARMEGYEVMPALEAAARGDVFITVTGGRGALRGEHLERMKDGAVLANAGHFDVEIDLPALRDLAAGPPREVRPLVEQYEIACDPPRRLNLLARGRVVNLAAAEGHPAAVMDVSFALQALVAEHLARTGGDLEPAIHAVPSAIDHEVARLKLASLDVRIDTLDDDQRAYLRTFR
ncbi:MAG: adenosylhomocysteinase [Solirubrobacteraceae bacterium MAG38_C4-C5]|nr:adenosylhomocysteinase [Candidatus Siliceabacter maunaloa]